MNLRSRATLALPLVILLAGFIIPLMMGAGVDEGADVDDRPGTHAGRTAAEWEALARRALARGAYDRAISAAKSAESADAGEQYGELLDNARRARWRARQIDRNAERFLGRPAQDLVFESDGAVADGVRVAIALPGESLWTMATAWVAADRDALPSEIDDRSPDVYAAWDRLTAANGVRELEVGEEVLIPLLDTEMEAIAEANRRDMASLGDALAAADAGDPDGARSIIEGVTGRFALASSEYHDVIEAVSAAEEERKVALEQDLIIRASDLVESSRSLSRVASHGELVRTLREAMRCLDEAEELSGDERYAQPRAAVEQMLDDVERYRVAADGSVSVLKPAGVAYTEAAADAVEWLLGRELVWSGASFPMSGAKTDDERAWARYLIEAARLARASGVDVERLIADHETETEIALPNPEDYFASGI